MKTAAVEYFPSRIALLEYLRNGGMVQDSVNMEHVYRLVTMYDHQVIQRRNLGSFDWRAVREPGFSSYRFLPLGPDQDRHGTATQRPSTVAAAQSASAHIRPAHVRESLWDGIKRVLRHGPRGARSFSSSSDWSA
jgi:hypothetical protein